MWNKGVLQWCSTVVVTMFFLSMRGLDVEQRSFAMVLHSCGDNGFLVNAWLRCGTKVLAMVLHSCCDNGFLVNARPGWGTEVFCNGASQLL